MRSRYHRDVLTFAISLLIINNALSQTATVSNSAPITINTGNVASIYPSTINVSGVTGVITNVTITIHNFSHSRPDDVDMLLVGPAGQAFVFWSDAGGIGATDNVTNQTFTISDAAASLLSDENALISGTYKPTNYEATADVFAAPAPAGPYHGALPSGTSTLAVFNATNPNGVWSLYIIDDAISGSNGSIAGGWTLAINTSAGVVTPSVTINQASGQTDPATAGPINFTAIFNEPVTGFESSDVTISGTAGATTAVVTEITPNNGTRYNVAVTGMTSTGTVIASLPAGIAVNSGSVGNTASTSIDNVITFSQPPSEIPVTVTINQAVSQSDPTNTGPVNFTVVFSEPVTGFISTDVLLSGTAAATSVSITEIAPNNGTTYNVAVSGMSISGTVIATLPSNIALSLTNVGNNASTSTDNTVNYIEPPALPVITTTYTNSSGITMSTAAGVANPYPSTINVSGLTGTVTNVTLVITGFSHTRPDNIDMLLVGPAGQTLLFWSDAGGTAPADNVTNQNFTFSDAAATFLSDESLLVGGTYRPTNYGATADVFQAPAPSGPYNESGPFGTFRFNVFRGSDPNGVWSLYIINDGTQISAPTISGWTLNLTTTVPLPAVGSLIISEFRLRGPGGTNDEFIEIYNPTAFDHTVRSISGGYGIATSDGTTRATIPNDVVIKAKQHYLLTGSTYSLANYGGTGAAAGNISYATDIPDNMGIAIFNNNTGGASYTLENRIDAVGSSTEANALYKEGTSYTALSALNLESSLRRKSYNGEPQDSDDNSSDFEFVDNAGTVNGGQERLGAPGPENLASPVARNANVVITRLDQTIAAKDAPNTVRNFTSVPQNNSPFGTIEFRYRVTNNTGVDITRIRFRLDSLTTLPAGVSKADLRAITSTDITVNGVNEAATCASTGSPTTTPCGVTVRGTTLEQPPVQAKGGGFNSTLTVALPSALAAGASMNIRLVFGVVKTGDYSIKFTPEVLPHSAAIGPVPPPEKISGATDPIPVTINQASAQTDPTSASPINFTAVFGGAVTGFTSSDVTLSGTAGATTVVISEIAPNDGTTYNVAVSGMTTTGTVIATIPAGVVSNSGNVVNTASTSVDNTVTFSSTSGTGINVTINQASIQTDPTDISPINFTVVFSEAVSGFTGSDVALSGTAGATTALVTQIAPNNGTTYNVAVSGMTASGTVIATIPAGVAGNTVPVFNNASTSADNTVTFELLCTATCPDNITTQPTSSSGAVVNYSVATAGDCGTITSLPASGTTFPIGTTTVNSYRNLPQEIVYGLTSDNKLVSFSAANPSVILSTVTISGLQPGIPHIQNNELIEAIDFRPSNGQLYALAVASTQGLPPVYKGRIYTINISTGVATAVTSTPFDIFSGSSMDFDPVDDEIRIVSSMGFNLRVNPDTGAVIETDEGTDSFTLQGIAYSNNFSGATSTTLYAVENMLDDTKDALYIQGGINGIPSPNSGSLTLTGYLGTDLTFNAGFDISQRGTVLLSTNAADNARLYSVSLTTGAATLIGSIGNVKVKDISIAPVSLSSPSCSFTVTVNPPQPPTITCPSGNITLYTDPGQCNAMVDFAEENYITITGSPAPTISYQSTSSNGGSSGSGSTDLPVVFFNVGVNTVTFTATNDGGTATCSFTVTVIDNTPPVIVCPENKVVNAQPGTCRSAMVSFTIPLTEVCPVDVLARYGTNTLGWQINNGATNTPLIGSFEFSVGINTVSVTASDASGNTSTCSFTVTVLDNEKPVITASPGDVTVECASQIPAVNIATVSASDNCGTPTITHVDDVIGNQTCANKYTVTRTYRATDGSGNTATVSQLITIDDKTPPTITGLAPSKRILAPPNHKMVDVTLAYTVNDNCVSTPNVTVNITSNEPINGTGDGDTDPDWEVIDAHHIRLRAERAGNGTGRIYTITVTVSDGCNAGVSATTEVYVVHNITGPHSGNSFKVGSTVAFTGEFWDVPGNKHTAKWLIDGISVNGVVTEPVGSKNGKVTGSYKFTTPGVYKLQMNITDQKGVTTYANTNGDLEAIVVIYDPNGGYTYGGGYYDSPAGALISNTSSAGKASYGFTMNYFKNSTNPKGETQFEFKVGEFEYNALNFDYLVISNSMAQFKGTGKIIGGQSGIAFIMTVVDGQLDGTGIDKIRMKIYNKNNGKIIYDNQPGASDAALPVQAIGANSSIVISGTNASLTKSNTTTQQATMETTESKVPEGLDVIVYPNPSINDFSLIIKSNANERTVMQVVDMYGREVETRNITANSFVRFGEKYRSGAYFVRLIQGKHHKELKLIKIN